MAYVLLGLKLEYALDLSEHPPELILKLVVPDFILFCGSETETEAWTFVRNLVLYIFVFLFVVLLKLKFETV